jgi:DNA-binding MarR family transcriptional regulator
MLRVALANPDTALDGARFTTTLERLFALMRRLSPAQELSLTAASTLRTLDQHGPHRLTDLAAKEGVTQPAMTQLVSRLERDGLAERSTDATDGRVVRVRITAKGRALLSRRREVRAERLADLLAALPADDEARIAAALPALERLTELMR